MTGEKALYINEGFTRRIAGFKKEESDYLLRFLFDHLARSADLHVRASYEPGTVVILGTRLAPAPLWLLISMIFCRTTVLLAIRRLGTLIPHSVAMPSVLHLKLKFPSRRNQTEDDCCIYHPGSRAKKAVNR